MHLNILFMLHTLVAHLLLQIGGTGAEVRSNPAVQAAYFGHA